MFLLINNKLIKMSKFHKLRDIFEDLIIIEEEIYKFLFPSQYKAKKTYSKIKGYHPKIIELYNNLFDIELTFPRLKFGGYFGEYCGKKDKIRFGFIHPSSYKPSDFRKKKKIGILEDSIDMLCEEEAHRYHAHVNPYSPYHSNSTTYKQAKKYKNYGLCWTTFTEGVARYAKTAIFKEIGFDNLYELWEPLSYKILKIGQYHNHQVLDPDHVFSFLRNKSLDYFREFVHKNPFEAIECVYPDCKNIKNLDDIVQTILYI